MSKWSAMAALGEMAKGGGQYFGTLYSESVKSQRLAEARAERRADLAESRAFQRETAATATATRREDVVTAAGVEEETYQGRRSDKVDDAVSAAQAKQNFNEENPTHKGTVKGKDGFLYTEDSNGNLTKTDTEFDEGSGINPYDRQTAKLHKTLSTEMKQIEYHATKESLGKMENAIQSGNHMSDAAMIFYFMKTLDPASVVRESEFRTVQQARAFITRSEESGIPLPTVVVQMIQSLKGEGTLTPEQRSQIMVESRGAFEVKQERADSIMESLRITADRQGLDHREIGFRAFGGGRPRGEPQGGGYATDGDPEDIPDEDVDAYLQKLRQP